jgi:hypothetical protein
LASVIGAKAPVIDAEASVIDAEASVIDAEASVIAPDGAVMGEKKRTLAVSRKNQRGEDQSGSRLEDGQDDGRKS